MKPNGSVGRPQGGGHDDPGEDATDGTAVGGGGPAGVKAGSRLISQLIGEQAVGKHDRTRRDGASPSPTRRTHSIGLRRAHSVTPSDLGYPTRRSQSSHAAVKTGARPVPKRGRGSESDASSSEFSSSPDTSPGSTPTCTPATTPRILLSPKNSDHLHPVKTSTSKRSAKSPYARPSAVFCGGVGRGKIKPTPLNKSASDGMERLRSSAGLWPVKGKGASILDTGEKKVLCDEVVNEQLRNKLSRVSSDSRVDELLAQAYMALESLTPEHSAGGPVVMPERPPPPGASQQGHDALRRLAITHARKENGKSYKDLTQILQEKIEELDAMVSPKHGWVRSLVAPGQGVVHNFVKSNVSCPGDYCTDCGGLRQLCWTHLVQLTKTLDC